MSGRASDAVEKQQGLSLLCFTSTKVLVLLVQKCTDANSQQLAEALERERAERARERSAAECERRAEREQASSPPDL